MQVPEAIQTIRCFLPSLKLCHQVFRPIILKIVISLSSLRERSARRTSLSVIFIVSIRFISFQSAKMHINHFPDVRKMVMLSTLTFYGHLIGVIKMICLTLVGA